eukprot:7726428-Karenia_brevis.AAC.1
MAPKWWTCRQCGKKSLATRPLLWLLSCIFLGWASKDLHPGRLQAMGEERLNRLFQAKARGKEA